MERKAHLRAFYETRDLGDGCPGLKPLSILYGLG
jgi:hypothetical protein